MPCGGVVLDGAVSPTDTTLLFRIAIVGPLGFAAPFLPGFTSGSASGVGTVSGADLDVVACPPASAPAFRFSSESVGGISDIVFISAATIEDGEFLGFYLYDGLGTLVVPEPGAGLLLGGALLALGVGRRCSRRA